MGDTATRACAARIVLRVMSAKAKASLTTELRRAGRRAELQHPLLQRLVKGTLSHQTHLDELVDRALGGAKRMPGFVTALLKLAAYQLQYFEMVDPRQVSHETLSLAKDFVSSREISELKSALASLARKQPRPRISARSIKELAVCYSHPEWLLEELLPLLGMAELAKFCEANNRPWPVCARVNTLRTNVSKLVKHLYEEWIHGAPHSAVPDSLVLERISGALSSSRSLRGGFMQVQDPSATLVGFLLDPKPGEQILDMCAAPGGKTSHAATLMGNRGLVLALDADAARLRPLRENVRRLGLRNVKTRCIDALAFDSEHEHFDRVLLDAPCSGFGVLGRKTDVRWRKASSDVDAVRLIQMKLLTKALSLVKPGGRIVYSTCTVTVRENESVIREFLKSRADVGVCTQVPMFANRFLTREGFFRTWPQRDGMGGSFCAVLQRSSP